MPKLLMSALLSIVVAGGAVAAATPTPSRLSFPGVITLRVDATNVAQKIFVVSEDIPVTRGPMTLLYPKWVLGTHAPAGVLLSQFAGLILQGNGRRLEWRRDPLDVYAFHLNVPSGVTTLNLQFQFLSPVDAEQGAIVATREMLALHWEALLLYPAGYRARGISILPSVLLPPDWRSAAALEFDAASAAYKAVDLETLIDSPLYAGKYFKRVDLEPGASVPVFLDMFADSPENLQATPEQINSHRALVQQAHRLFGSQHFNHYDFLLALSDEFSFAGLEHHQSSENGVRSTYFSEWQRGQAWRSNLVSHEFTHSWDGKFRRPSDQLTANFNEPLQDSLLWVYEGGTSYWGHVLGARSGLVEASQMRDGLAATAALYDHRIGRVWRSLSDTTNEPIITRRSPLAWVSWQRSEDYYSEGELIWFDADTKIRELSGDSRSLDDFARRFFGIQDGRVEPLGYSFEDVVSALNATQVFDWAAFLHARLDGHGPGAPLDGLARAGWRLEYSDTPTEYFKDVEAYRKVSDFTYSLGFAVGSDGLLVGVLWNGPAFRQGLTTGITLLAVNGRAYKPDLLRSVITAAKGGQEPIELLFRQGDRYQTEHFSYHDGLRYPRLARIEGTPDRLEAIFKPLP